MRYGYHGDADMAVAAVARVLGCPVLSDDTDLWMLNVPCVRMEKGHLLLRRPKIELRARDCRHFHLEVEVFRPERLVLKFLMFLYLLPCFVQPDLLP